MILKTKLKKFFRCSQTVNSIPEENRMSGFKFSQRSLKKLVDVDDDLVEVCHLALQFSEVDFGISEGLRTKDRQRELFESGKSQTMNSKHLDNPSTPDIVDSWAVDVYAYVNGSVSWDIKYYIKIAEAFRQAGIELDHKIRWGGSWTVLNNEPSADQAYKDYVDSRKKPFVDGPHFEIIKG